MITKSKLSNKNTFIWLGNQPIYGCDDVLILAGGEVQFLKPVKRLQVAEIQNDITRLTKKEFFEKYHWPENSSGDELYYELAKIDEYPGYKTQ